MKKSQIHPRMLERIRQLWSSEADQMLDPQIGAYLQLSKTAKALSRFDDAEEIPEYRETGAFCAKAAKAVRRQAIEGLRAGDFEKLQQVYEKLAVLSREMRSGLKNRSDSSTERRVRI